MNFLDWLKENILLSFRVDLTNLKIRSIFVPLYLILQIGVYLYFKDSLAQNGFWVIFIPAMTVLILLLIYLIPKRNDPNYLIYYVFHLSKVSKFIILVGIIFFIILFFYAQCPHYGLTVGLECVRKVF